MKFIYAEYNMYRNSLDVDALAIDEPFVYARLYLDGNMQMWVNAEASLKLY